VKDPIKKEKTAKCWWLIPVILATQEAEIKLITVGSEAGQIVHKTLPQKTISKKMGLVEWLKEKALSSSRSTPPSKKG
jgi:hypothetical protein